MKAVWTNFAKVFPEYAGGDSFFGTNANGAKTLFYQGKAAMMINMASGIVEYNNDMKALDSGEEVEDSEGNAIENVQKFTLGTFNMPSMEGDAFEAKARTIEVSNGFVGCISKDQAHYRSVQENQMHSESRLDRKHYIQGSYLPEPYHPPDLRQYKRSVLRWMSNTSGKYYEPSDRCNG